MKSTTVVSCDFGEYVELLQKIDANPTGVNYVHVDKDGSSDSTSLSRIALGDNDVRQLLVEFAARGYYLYAQRGSVSSFAQERKLKELWAPLINGKYKQHHNGLIYHLEPAQVISTKPKLLVIFASMSGDIFSNSLHRYFPINFKSISKFITPDTYILRIADFGGVAGTFYLDTSYDRTISTKVQDLIQNVAKQFGVIFERTVLLGASKGGTAATYYGLVTGYKFIAVDPVVSESIYWTRYNDMHFTKNRIFPKSKDEIFDILCKEHSSESLSEFANKIIIYSERSPQFAPIKRIMLDNIKNALFVNNTNEEITDHPHVSPKSLHFTTSVVNSLLCGLNVARGGLSIQ